MLKKLAIIFLFSSVSFAGNNLVINSGAQDYIDFFGWFHSTGAYEDVINSPTTAGDTCFAVPEGNDIRTEKFAVSEGDILQSSYEYKTDASASGYINAYLRFWDATEQFVGQSGEQITSSASWQKIETQGIVVPQGAVLADWAFFPGNESGGNNNSFTGTFYFDGIKAYQQEIDNLNCLPLDNAERQLLHTTLQWDQQADADHYNLYMGIDETSLQLVSEVPDSPTQVKYAITLKPYRTYYWRVDTVRKHDTQITGDVYRFTTSFDLFENVAGAVARRYGATDSEGKGLDGIKVIENPEGGYIGVHHSYVYKPSLGKYEFDLRMATSTDLMTWTHVRTLIENADMPALVYHPETGGYFLTHEQWGKPGSISPSNLGFKYYPDTQSLMDGVYTRNYIAPISGWNNTDLEGTPNFYSISPDGNDILVGFHYFTGGSNVDNIASGVLTNFISGTTSWSAAPETVKNTQLRDKGIDGNIGDRDHGWLFGREYTMQEAQYVKYTWETWKGWVYDHELADYLQIYPVTDGGTSNYGNMTFTNLTSPAGKPAVFCSYFLFGEGAAPGEGGELMFYNELETKASTPNPSNGLTGVFSDIEKLVWLQGEGASYSNVYMDPDAATVYYADENSPCYQGSFSTPEINLSGLDCNTKYYWRVDEVSYNSEVTLGQLWSFTTTGPEADLSDDCSVDGVDFAYMAQQWLSESNPECDGDISGDCFVDFTDLMLLADGWLLSQ